MEASIDISSNPTSGLATCSVIVAVVDPNTLEISGAESLTTRDSHIQVYRHSHAGVPGGSISVAVVMEILNAASNERNASKAIGKFNTCSCSPLRNVTVDVAGT